MPRLDSNPCALGRASPLSGLCLCNQLLPACQFPLTSIPDSETKGVPPSHLHTVLGKRTALGSNPPARRGCRGRQWLSEASEPHQVVLRAQIYCEFVTLRPLIPSHRTFLEIPRKKGYLPNPQVFTDLASRSLLRHSNPRPPASEPLEGKARGHGWAADAAEGPRARPLNGRAPYLRCSAGRRRSVQRAEGGGRLLPAQASIPAFI